MAIRFCGLQTGILSVNVGVAIVPPATITLPSSKREIYINGSMGNFRISIYANLLRKHWKLPIRVKEQFSLVAFCYIVGVS